MGASYPDAGGRGMIPAMTRERLYQIVFESDTPAGKAFDVALLVVIACSVAVVVLESLPSVHDAWGPALRAAEWAFTGLFTAEYLLRLYLVKRPLAYARSLFGLVDLLSLLPTWLSLVFPGAQSLLTVRALRLLRVFRVLRMVEYIEEAQFILRALASSARKISVFLGAVLTAVVVIGATMYVIEGPEHGFDSIPRAMYWAVVTLSTVGYGDISPKTPLGQFVASLVMMLGYSVLAVPTGIVTVELSRSRQASPRVGDACPGCGRQGHDADAAYCKHCGTSLTADQR